MNYLLGLLGLLILYGIALCLFHSLSLTRGILLFALVILFAPVFFAVVSIQRFRGELNGDNRDTLKSFVCHFSGCMGLCFLCSFLPDYSIPAMIPAIWLISICGIFPGICGSIFLLTLCWVGSGASEYALLAEILLVLYGAMGLYLKKNSEKAEYVYASLMIAGILIPSVCSCLETGSFDWVLLLFLVIGNLLTIGFLVFATDKLTKQRQEALTLHVQDIMRPEYVLAKDMKSYSEVDYEHAKKVSRIAAGCADSLEADGKLAAAAGFYYRLGKLEGPPFVENGVALAKEHCFPEPVVQILSEYNGEGHPISTLESAIVHISDCLVTKFELLDRETFQNNWNRDMVIYQTLNEKSSAGLYDKSGMSMNQFLKIRDYFTKGEDLF